MNTEDLIQLGKKVASLRLAKNIKQSELAFEAGVSERTLQRLEGGKPVKSDGLLKILRQLGYLDALLIAISPVAASPYALLEEAGIKPSELGVQQASKKTYKKQRVRRSASLPITPNVTVQWPEDTL